MSALLGDAPHYGSYQVLANLTIDMGIEEVDNYKRSLDLRTGVYEDRFDAGGVGYERHVLEVRRRVLIN